MSSKNHEANDDRHNSDSLIIAQYSPVCFLSYEKWVQRGKYPKNTRLILLEIIMKNGWLSTVEDAWELRNQIICLQHLFRQ